MRPALLQRLLDGGHATLVDEASLASFLQQQPHTVLFFAGDLCRYPESGDLAVILPELVKAFGGQFQAGLVEEGADTALQKRYGFSHWPTLVVVRGEGYLGAISRLRNWVEYCAEIQRLLQGEPVPPPGTALPVIGQNSTACS